MRGYRGCLSLNLSLNFSDFPEPCDVLCPDREWRVAPCLDSAAASALRTHVRMQTPYVELHAHSAFSFLDGASTPLELASRAAGLGYPAFSLTDHDGVWGSLEFAPAFKGVGVLPITGGRALGSHRRQSRRRARPPNAAC